MKKKRNIPMAALLAAALLLSGCGSDKSSASLDEISANTSYAAADDSGWATETFSEAYGEEAAGDAAAAAEMKSTESTASPGENGVLTPQEASANDLSNRKLIKNVSLSLETEEFDTMKTSMEESISSFGGYVEYSSYDAPQSGYLRRSYSLTARIPAEKLDEFVTAAGQLGTLTNKSENVEDVTLDYVDKTAYKESLQVEYDRVTELLEKADDLDQVLALESKLSQLRYEINSYESQLRTYDNLISYSTVNIYILEVEHVTETSNTIGSRISSNFLSSLYSIRDFFVNLFVFLVGNLPVLLLLAVVIVFIVLFIKRFWKLRAYKTPEKQKKLFRSHSSGVSAPDMNQTGDIPDTEHVQQQLSQENSEENDHSK